MTDIAYGEHIKKIFRMLLKLGYKFLKTDMRIVGKDLEINQNPVIRNLNNVLILAANGFKSKGASWQREITLGYGQAFLWIITKDTAYRDVFFWALDKVLQHATALRKMIKPYVKEPKDWLPNQWAESKEKSRFMQKKKKIPKNAKSMEETMFMPGIQEPRHKKLLEKRR